MSLHAALVYAARGFSVIPANGKLPHFTALREACGSSGWARFQESPASPDIIQAWYEVAPDAGVAIITGTASGIVVADIEHDHLDHPVATRILGIPTAVATTPRGGRHVYFSAPPNPVTTRHVGWGDVQAEGAYVIAPPDELRRGWLFGLDEGLATAESLQDLLGPEPPVTLRGISPLEVSAVGAGEDETTHLPDRLADWDARPAFVEAVTRLLGIPSRVGEKFPCILPGHQPDRRPSANLTRFPGSGHVLYRCWQTGTTLTLTKVFAAATAGRPPEVLLWSPSIHAMWKLRLLLRAGLIHPESVTRLSVQSSFPTRFLKHLHAVEELFDVRAISRLGRATPLVPEFFGQWIGQSPETAKELRQALRAAEGIHRTGQKHRNASPTFPAPVRSDPVLALILERLLPTIEKHVEDMVERRVRDLVAPEPDPWMTTTEAAHYLRLSPEALRARVRRRTIPAHRDEHRWLFHRDELDHHVRHGDRHGRYPAARQQLVAPATALTVRGRDLKE